MTEAVQSPVAEPKAKDKEANFLTKEQLLDKTRFKVEEETVDIPELGGKVLLGGISLAKRTSLRKRVPLSPLDWEVPHTAILLAGWVTEPKLTEEEWAGILKPPFPAKAWDRINRKIAQLAEIADEEELAAAIEFPGTD